ncbi:MAG: GAF domain-containing protein, partial [Ignavibacteriae bacterium]
GPNIQLMCDAIPPLELVVGRHEMPGSLPSAEEANRFVFTFESLITAISNAEHPVVLFLDDLQWADVASLQLLERVLLSEQATCLAIVGAYRDNEVDALHPLMGAMKRLSGRVEIEHLHLDRLSERSIADIVADTLRCSADDVRDLADYLSTQTEGNPLFLTQSLSYWHDTSLITYDEQSRSWTYNIQAIRSAGIPDNVVDLVVANIRRLPEDAQVALQIAACIGNEFELDVLRTITTGEQRRALLVAVENGLIRSVHDNYLLLVAPENTTVNNEVRFRFLHDRVQQAAHSMLPELDKNRIHVQLGWSLFERSKSERSEDSVFVIAGHLNHGHDLITEPNQRSIVARVNLEAGIQARKATAYDQAVGYVENGIALLPDVSYRQHDNLWYLLHLEYGHSLYLRGDTAAAERVLTQILATDRTRMEKIRVLQIIADMFSNLNEHERVIDTLETALLLFSVSMPRKPLLVKMAVLRGIIEMKLRTRGRDVRSMVDDKVNDDPEMIALLDLVMATGPSAYVYSQDVFAWLVLFQAIQSRKYGNMPNSALGYAGYGMILSTAFGDISTAIEYLELAESINERFGNLSLRHKVGFIRCHFLGHFRHPVPELLQLAEEVFHSALEAGDPLYAGFCLADALWYEAGTGKNLTEICRNADAALRVLEKIKNINGHDLYALRLQPLRVLAGLPLLPWTIGDNDQTWDERLEADLKAKSFGHVVIDCLFHLQTSYMLGKSIELDNVIEIGHKYHEFVLGNYLYADLGLYMCLVIYTLHGERVPRPLRQVVRIHQKQMNTRRKECPANYQHHAGIINAVVLLMNGRVADAEALLTKTVATAEREGFINIVGVGSELLGQLALKQQKPADAGRYLKIALQAFERWGAITKVRQLQEHYPDILLTHAAASPSGIEEDIDLSSLMKSAVAISGEIRIDKLLPSLINIVVENAGAQLGQLYLNDEERFVLGASTTSEDVSPVSIVQYVRNTRETLVLNLPARDERFRSDRYIQRRNPKSVLCLPIVHQGTLKGVIYLENNLFVNAFTEQRISTMQILSAQIAVSLDNALLYKNLSHALETQVQLTEAYSRFTPKEYLKFLGRTSILDVRLGDHRSETMTVLFSDIRSYTSLAEELSAEDNFQFLSSYLRKMSEVVTRHNGLVNQLLGDGLLAFFWNSIDAVNAAVDMQLALEEYNVQRLQKGRRPISAGIGLHKGTVIIGIVGDATRMDASILSDTVNAASRIEGLTKHYRTKILMSESVVNDLDAHHRDLIRFIGKVQVKGKREAMGIHESIASDRPELKALKVQQHEAFSNALSLYVAGAFSQAADEFQSLINAEIEPDHVVHALHERSRHYLHHGTPEQWDGVEQISVK